VIIQCYGSAWRLGKSICNTRSTGLLIRDRCYKLNKIQENNDAEIMNVVLDEARESYAEEIVVELSNQSTEELESNVGRIIEWIKAWLEGHPDEA
jgi:adenylate kinase